MPMNTPTPVSSSWVLWFRPHRQTGWRAVGSYPTHSEAVQAVGTGDRRGGEWYIAGPGRGKPHGTPARAFLQNGTPIGRDGRPKVEAPKKPEPVTPGLFDEGDG